VCNENSLAPLIGYLGLRLYRTSDDNSVLYDHDLERYYQLSRIHLKFFSHVILFMHLTVFVDPSAAMLSLIRMVIRSQRRQSIKLEKLLREFLKRYIVNSFKRCTFSLLLLEHF
jgi:hypothetical protein